MTIAGFRPSRSLVLALCVVLVGGFACLSPRPVPEQVYYTLSLPGSPEATLPGAPHLERLAIDPVYDSVRLARRTSPYRLEYYSFHRWAADPREIVAAAARDYLARAAVSPDGQPLRISGAIRRLEEQDSGGERRGVVAIDFQVSQAGRSVLDRRYEESEPATAGSPEATVAALSRALARLLDRLAADLAAGT